MGETSEIGPIDAQIPIIQDNAEQWVSADHFLRARDEAIGKSKSSEPEIVQAAQIQLALLSPAFLQSCSDLLQFAKDFAGKQLRAHMFKDECQQEPALWLPRISGIVDNLTASSRHLIHGRMITAKDMQQDQDLQFLKTRDLASNDPYWETLNELLLRTEVIVQRNDLGKILFSRDFEMVSG